MEETRKSIYIRINKKKYNDIYPESSINDAYGEIHDFLKKENFIYKKGIGFVSLEKISIEDVEEIVKKLSENLPWLKKCVTKIICEEIGNTKSYK